MDKIINSYIESLVLGILNSPQFLPLPFDQKEQWAEKLRGKFYDVILETTIDNLTDEQILELKDIPADSPQMEEKITLFATTIPNLAEDLEKKLNEKYRELLKDPNLV